MNSRAETRAVAVSARTEYLTGRHHASARAGSLLLVAGLFALVVLNLAGAPGFLIATTVAALITASLGVVSYGRLGSRGAMLITVDADNVYFGSEDREIVSYPLSSLTAARRGGPAEATSTQGRHLTVRGQKYLKLTFCTDSEAGAGDEWWVAIVESDPAAAEILARLQAILPAPAAATTAEPTAQFTAEPSPAVSPPGPRIADAGTEEAAKRLWEDAIRRHNDILGAYGAYELDPAMLLRYPAITDVTVEQTQSFQLALDEAQALRTEVYPANRGLADAYQQAVVALRRAWIGCETHGKKVGTGYLDQADQDELDTALKLYNHAAASTTPAEQATYYGRVRAIVSRLAERGAIHPPKVQLAQLEGVTRRAIESAR
ncbi:hypothetical protein H7K14_20205 [Mycolicibacter longobardus]|uniref:hypothetical protein n=1 Tax=Mycolicibacter longobardus TaxID=1108812 RepID=UPI0021F3B252|nr:hypothetical protein [Mycolicibacter longobardus]MCV7386138.1 hypothetical protein [Mycolicibacter longobardus]